MSAKSELRQRLRKTIAAISPEERSSRSLRACHRLFGQPHYVRAEVIMVFLSLPDEIDTTPIVLRGWQNRKRVLAPRISWNQRRMIPTEIRSLTEDLAITEFGVREPTSGIPFPMEMIDMLIVPGLGFDEFGQRLGRGRGFYDRFLAHPEFKGIACAMALEEQMVPSVPVGPLDRQIDMLITDAKIRRFTRDTPPTS